MNINTLDDFFTNISNNINIINTNINEIKNNYNPESFTLNNDNLKLIHDICSNINILKDQIEDLNLDILQKCSKKLSYEQKKEIRDNNINKQIQKILLPYMLYLKIHFENS